MRRIGRYVLRKTRLARCDSYQTAEALQAHGFGHVRYVPFIIPWLDEFRPTAEDIQNRLGQWEREPVLLCVARLSAEKNVALLLRAFSRISDSIERARLHIVGSGPQEHHLKSLAECLGIGPKVKWLGALDYLSLPPLFHAANVFVLSSDSETSARVLTMAQVACLPTITTDTSGSASVVRNEITGYVVPVGDETAFADRLARLLDDRHIYRRFAKADYSAAASGHDERVIMGPLRQFYEDVCA
jgi:glycosyltransferase involved in cell wall biosynthesis